MNSKSTRTTGAAKPRARKAPRRSATITRPDSPAPSVPPPLETNGHRNGNGIHEFNRVHGNGSESYMLFPKKGDLLHAKVNITDPIPDDRYSNNTPGIDWEGLRLERYIPAKTHTTPRKTPPPLIIIHSGEKIGEWTMDGLCKELIEHGYECCVVTPKKRASMKTHAADLERFVKQPFRRPLVLIGHRKGSAMCNYVAWKNPKRVKAFCSLLATPCRPIIPWGKGIGLRKSIKLMPLLKSFGRLVGSFFLLPLALECTQLVIASKQSPFFPKYIRWGLGGEKTSRLRFVDTKPVTNDDDWRQASDRIVAWLDEKFPQH